MPGEQHPVRYAFPAFRVFIYGLEVTDDVLSVNINMHDGDMPGQCTINLVNELDRYIVTTNDMRALAAVDLSERVIRIPWLSQADDQGSTDSEYQDKKLPGVFDPVKRNMLTKKGLITQDIELSNRTDPFGNEAASINQKYFDRKVDKYPISDGSPIFHPMDPVRVFFRDPYNPSRWYHMFCGFVSDMIDTTSENNVKTMVITVEDPTKLFRYSRAFINPGILDADKVIHNSEIRFQTAYQSPMAGMSLPEVVYTLVFGQNAPEDQFIQQVDSLNGSGPLSTRTHGIGHFSFDTSVIATVGPAPPKGSAIWDDEKRKRDGAGIREGSSIAKDVIDLGNNLAAWQLMLDHEVKPSDMQMMTTEADRTQFGSVHRLELVKSNGEPDIEKIITYIGSRPDQYPVDAGRIMILIPRSLGVENNKIVIGDIIGGYPLQSDATTAGAILHEILSRIEFTMYCSPRGDIVIEPPLYDFDPDIFGMEPLDDAAIKGLFNGVLRHYPQLESAATRWPLPKDMKLGPYGPNYVILKRDTYNWENAFIDDKVHTLAVVAPAIVDNMEGIGFMSLVGHVLPVWRESLIPLYGVRLATPTPRGYIYTTAGARLYGEMCLNRLNADAHTFRVSHLPNIKLWLNRPTYIQGRNAIATPKSITHNLTWGQAGDMTTSMEMYASRTWDGTMSKDDPTRPVYTGIGGYDGRMLDYAQLFGIAPEPEKKE